MDTDDQDADTVYVVLVNDEEQYSLWLKDQPIPRGWRGTGREGTRQQCGDYVREVWTDMRPLSLRRNMSQVSIN
jgi:MbtH protein